MEENPISKQRRSCQRYPVNITAKIIHENNTVNGTITNISYGGIYIQADQIFPFETVLKVQFQVEGIDMEATAKVIWNRREDDTGMGLCFDALRAQEVWALNNLFNSLEAL